MDNKQDVFVASLIFLVGMASFGLGRLSAIWPKKEPITITKQELIRNQEEKETAESQEKSASASVISAHGNYVASKQGSKYHFPWCIGARNIKEENKIWFETAEAARAKGYQPAQNCPDLD